MPGWTPSENNLTYPLAPQNVEVVSPLLAGTLDLRWDDPSLVVTGPGNSGGQSNTLWDIVGVNVYRSDSGERGLYHRANSFPVGIMFFRDRTDNVLVTGESVDWDSGWLSKGDKSNNRQWQFRTKQFPIVKAAGLAIAANSPADVTLSIDGVVIPVHAVFGPRGEITLINVRVYDLARDTYNDPTLPVADGTSDVRITYRYNRNLVDGRLDQNRKRFYRVATVAIDTSTPSGLVETPLEYCEPITGFAVERMDYIWKEAIRRNNWILEQGGERVKLYIRKTSGVKCTCNYNARNFEYSGQPLNNCTSCVGTGFVGGYEGPYDIILAPDDGERAINQTPEGRRLNHSYEVWTGPSPMISQRDFIVKQTNERYSVGPVRLPSNRGNVMQQHFQIAFLDTGDIRYGISPASLADLAFPETRATLEDDNTFSSASRRDEPTTYPVGTDYQASPMVSEKDNIPDERQKRGRTKVWENQNF